MSPRDVNRETWRSRRTVRSYRGPRELQPAEKAILDRLEARIRGGAILDLGVGGGRTTPHLTRLSGDYVGLDYSPGMVAQCRQRFPGLDFRHGDARDLSCFETGRFDFVLFSYNGLDYVGHRDRLAILEQIHRVLKEGGTLAFSSHNLDFEAASAFRFPAAGDAGGLLGWIKAAAAWPVGVFNHLRLRRFETEGDDYAIRNDPGRNYSLLTYHVRPEAQRVQLEELGYRDVQAVDFDGRFFAPAEPRPCSRRSPWIYYVARK